MNHMQHKNKPCGQDAELLMLQQVVSNLPVGFKDYSPKQILCQLLSK